LLFFINHNTAGPVSTILERLTEYNLKKKEAETAVVSLLANRSKAVEKGGNDRQNWCSSILRPENTLPTPNF
jgi:hypothetical protein